MGIWRNGNASDFGSEDCRFDPCYARLFVIFFYYYWTHSSLSLFLSLNGNVAQSVERKSHNLKVVSSILTVPTFFSFFNLFFLFSFLLLLSLSLCLGVWRNGNASDFGSEDCRFDPCYARLFSFFSLSLYPFIFFFLLFL